MDSLRNEEKRAKLNAIWILAQRAGLPLLDALQNFLIQQDSNFGTGRTVISHAGAGKNTVLVDPKPGQQRQHGSYYALAQQLIELFTVSYQSLQYIAANSLPVVTNPDLSDQAVFNFMMSQLPDSDSVMPDFTNLLIYPR